MRDYAVTLEFDKETENKIQEMIDEVARVTGCDYMKQSVCYLSWSGNERVLAEYMPDSKCKIVKVCRCRKPRPLSAKSVGSSCGNCSKIDSGYYKRSFCHFPEKV